MTTALVAAGYTFDRYHAKIPLEDWLADWAKSCDEKAAFRPEKNTDTKHTAPNTAREYLKMMQMVESGFWCH